jgi:Lipase (class 3)
MGAPCPFQVLGNQSVPRNVNLFPTAIIDPNSLPPVRQWIAPPPPPPPPVPVPPGLGPSVSFTSLDCYWMATLCRALMGTDALLQRTLLAKGAFLQYERNIPPVTPGAANVLSFYAEMSDRVVIGMSGVANVPTALQFIMSHAVGSQSLLKDQYWNTSFLAQAQAVVALYQTRYNVTGQRPLLVLGHSNGAACAPIVANALLSPRLNMFDRIATFGCPRNWTQSGITSGSWMQILRFCNPGDIVTTLPPQLFALSLVSGLGLIGGYPGGDYAHATPALYLAPNGGLTPGPDQNAPASEWATQFVDFCGNLGSLSPHYIGTYATQSFKWFNADISTPSLYLPYDDWQALPQINNELAAIGL